MTLILIILATLLPGLFWLWYFNRYDLVDKEPLGELARGVLYGALAVIPALLWEAPFREFLHRGNSIVPQLALSFAVVGFGEEAFKLLAAYLIVGRSASYDEPMDGIIYAIAVAVGFSIIENILYISAFGLVIAPLRVTVATLAHVAFSGLAGYHLGQIGFSDKPKIELSKGLGLAVFLHGAYDFLLITRLASPLTIVGFLLLLQYWLLSRIRLAVQSSPLR